MKRVWLDKRVSKYGMRELDPTLEELTGNKPYIRWIYK